MFTKPNDLVNPFKKIWETTTNKEEKSRTSEKSKDNKSQETNENLAQSQLGWIMSCAALVLILVVAALAYLSVKRSEKDMAQLLSEKGSSLLRAFESAIRTGMRGEHGVPLQALLEEMSTASDIEFVAVTMPDGIIIAHSDKFRIGEIMEFEEELLDSKKIENLNPQTYEQWKIVEAENKRVFLLYRYFTLNQQDWTKDVPKPIIFLGLEVDPFEITNKQNRSYIAILSVITIFIGLTCLLAIFYAQKAAESRKSQRHAEGQVKRLEEEVRRHEKLAAIGTLAAGVAHEIRNPLSSIKSFATYFRDHFPDGSDDKEAASIMVKEVDRLNRVISDLLGLSRQDNLQAQQVDLNLVIDHVVRLLHRSASNKNIKLSIRKAPHVPLVMCDMQRLSQAILNLCLNSVEAMPDGGELTIAITGGKKQIRILVVDNGQGIPENIISQIFDPYFTTKGSGTGLGLPMVHKIILAHKGTIDVKSRIAEKPGEHGETIFTITLPLK